MNFVTQTHVTNQSISDSRTIDVQDKHFKSEIAKKSLRSGSKNSD